MEDGFLSSAPTVANAKYKMLADMVLSGKTASAAARELGYSPKTVGAQSSKILALPDVRAYLEYHRAEASKRVGVDKEQITEELSRLAFSNVADFTRLNADGDLEVDFSGATREQLSAVSGVKVKKRKIFDQKGNVVGEEHQSEFKLWDKIRAAELLGKDIGMFKEPEQKVVVDVADRLLMARARVRGAMIDQGGEAE